MQHIRWSVGTQQRDGEPTTHEQRGRVVDLLLKHYGGFTVTPGHGYWVDPNGKLCIEVMFTFEVVCDSEDFPAVSPRTVAKEMARLTNQRAVMFTVSPVKVGGIATDDGDTEEENPKGRCGSAPT